ncbi:MAG: metal ABC transporter permease [Verrucomicrobiota bacterium]
MSLEGFMEYGFLARALVAGVLLAIVCGLLSPWVVLRRLSFAADGLAHASIGGLAVGLVLVQPGASPSLLSYFVAYLFTCLVALGIAHLTRHLQSDAAVGVCYVSAFALGVAILSSRNRGMGHVEHVLFGSLLTARPLEILMLGILTGFVTLCLVLDWEGLGAWTFDEELARAEGVSTHRLRIGLMMLIAATVIVATRIVGVLLVAALLILPGSIGCLLAGRLWTLVVVSTGVSVGAAVAGIAVSNQSDIPPGPAIVLCAFAVLLVALASTRLLRRFGNPTRRLCAPHHPSPPPSCPKTPEYP